MLSRTVRRFQSAGGGGGAYDTGRLNLPFVGHATFNKARPVSDPSRWTEVLAAERPDVAVLGVPFDCGTQYRAGARFGPRAIRAASTLYSFGHDAVYSHEVRACACWTRAATRECVLVSCVLVTARDAS